MPVRLTPNKSLLISYDADSDSWITLEGMFLCLLSQYVDVEPGVTLRHVFDFIDRDSELKKFLAEYCSCDIGAVRTAKPENDSPIQVITGVEWDDLGVGKPTGVANVDQVVVSPFFYVYTDEATNERRLDGGYMLLGRSSTNETCATTLGGPSKYVFSQLQDFELRLNTEMNSVYLRCAENAIDDDKMDDGSEDTRSSNTLATQPSIPDTKSKSMRILNYLSDSETPMTTNSNITNRSTGAAVGRGI